LLRRHRRVIKDQIGKKSKRASVRLVVDELNGFQNLRTDCMDDRNHPNLVLLLHD
jgi:hypothetical protein